MALLIDHPATVLSYALSSSCESNSQARHMSFNMYSRKNPDTSLRWCSQSTGVGQGYIGPKTGDQGQGIEPGTHNRLCRKCRGSNPVPSERSCCNARGLNPGPTKKIVCTIVHTIAQTIARAIVIIDMRTQAREDA